MVGQVLGNYQILQLLGTGGMGEVYLAQHRRLARKAAVKILRPELSANPGLVERFFTEARAASMIRHRGIVEILDCDVHEGCAYIVMEFLEGETLATYLRRMGALARTHLTAALLIMREAAQAIGAAHEAGIVHRDLKPDNVFLARSSDREHPVQIKILDFGIAKLLGGDGGNASLTRTGNLLGTPLYMSPEQCRGIPHIDARADIYALGCMLYEMLTGRPPFVRENAGDLLVAHITESPGSPAAIEPTIPPALDALVARMLAKAPEDRPGSMFEIYAELGALAGGATATPVGRTVVLPETSSIPSISPPFVQPAQARTTPLPPSGARTGGGALGASTTFRSSAGQVETVDVSPGSRRRWLLGGGVTIGLLSVAGWLLLGGQREPAPAVPAPPGPAPSASPGARSPEPKLGAAATDARASAPEPVAPDPGVRGPDEAAADATAPARERAAPPSKRRSRESGKADRTAVPRKPPEQGRGKPKAKRDAIIDI